MLDIETRYPDLPWLQDIRSRLTGLVESDRCPHALLLQGREGMGRRHLALWLAAEILGTDPAGSVDESGEHERGHPDFILVERGFSDSGKRKQGIGVDQIRELINFLTLTSHAGRGRVAVVYPAEKMSTEAANCLLKTLEEPPAGTHIVLVSETLRSLPATVVSRCQRFRLPAPQPAEVLPWLEQQAPGANLANMLDFVGGAPLAALQLHAADFAVTANAYAADLQGLEQRQVSPGAVAARWQKQPDLALQWLYWRLARRVRQALDPAAAEGLGPEQRSSALRSCFRQMSQIRELRRVINGGISAELSLAGLLMDWYGGLGQH